MRTFLKVFAFNIVIIGFFLYVGNSIPQLRQDPPKELVLAADAPVEDFVKAGQDIFYGKGTCALCHEIGKKGERCPDLAGVGERAETRIDKTRQGLKVGIHANRGDPAAVPVAAVFVDIAMAIVLDMCRMNAGAALRPVVASLRRPEPAGSEAYLRFFGCPVRFRAAEDAFVLSLEDADRPLPSSNRQLAAVFDRLLAAELARLDRSNVVARCQAEVLEHLASGEMKEHDMAKRLHMSRRTLQRKLAEVDTTYLQLVDDTRRDLALRYIEDETRSIGDIAFTLGFSQQSAFTRAFRRWTGLNPTEYRSRAAPAGMDGMAQAAK